MKSRGIELRSNRLLATAAGIFIMLLTLSPSVSAAWADTEIGSPGTGAGETRDPRGVAVDETADLLYVVDQGNNRIDVFDASSGAFIKAFGWGVLDGSSELQVCTTTCLPGIAGSGAGQLNGAIGIAVDNDPASPGFHSIYVFENGNHRVQKFSPSGSFLWMVGGDVNETTGADLCTSASGDVCGAGTAGDAAGQFNSVDGDAIDVGPGGTVYVGDQVEVGTPRTRVQLYSPSGGYLGYLGGSLLEVAGGAGATTSLAVDSASNVYVGTNGIVGTGAVRKYDSSGNELYAINPSLNVNTIAVGPEDHVFVGDNSQFEGEINSTIYEYDSTGALLRAFYGSLEERTLGLAVYSNPNGDIFAVELGREGKDERILNIEFPPPGPLVYPKPSSLFAGPLGNTKATLHGKVNPEGEATTYHFEYITDEAFEAAGGTFGAGTVKTPESAPLPADFKLHPVQVELKNLLPETTYHFRIVVTSAATGPNGNPGPISTFLTKPPIEFGDIWSTDVGTTSAALHIEANPLGIPATGRFEYVELSKYNASGFLEATQVPSASEGAIALGEGEEMLEFSIQVSALQPGTSYRYRFVAINQCHPQPNPNCEFSEPEGTFTTFLPALPPAACPNDPFRGGWPGVEPGPGELLPDCRAYEMVSPIDKNGANIEAVATISGFVAGIDRAAVDGNSVTYSSYKAFGDVSGAPYTNQYLARRDPAAGWQSEAISPQREGPSLMTYLSAELDRQYQAFSPDLCSGWLVQDARPTLSPDAVDGYPGLYRRDNCDSGTGSYEALTTVEPPNLSPRRFIPEFQGASADGSVAIFGVNDNLTSDAPPQSQECVEETSTSAEACEARLYEVRDGQIKFVCVLPDGSAYEGPCGAGTTVAPIAGGSLRSSSLFNAISADGSHIFWSTSVYGPGSLYVRIGGTETVQISAAPARFWQASADGSKAIYSVGQQLYVFDVETETSTPIAGGVFGVAGASEDASRIYFASSEVLTGAKQNSYGSKAVQGRGNLYLFDAGNDPTFTFIASLSASEVGEDEPSLVSRFPIRRWVRVTPDGQRIAFMSASQLTGYDNTDAASKERDLEVFLFDATDDQLLCPSCNPTGARPEGRRLTQKLLEGRWAAARIPVFESQLYGQRVISDDGSRLYFNSFDALSVHDTNDREDVYQWEAAGTGSCELSSSTYHASAGGCIDLISSGKSAQGSELVDISRDGRDVFFKTSQSLVPQDPGLVDIYDARVEGGFPYPQPKPGLCEGESCQHPAAAPGAFSPSSRAAGPGNPKHRKRCPKGKRKVKRHGKTRCVKKKHHRKHHRRNHRSHHRGGQAR